jgi:hypothetical protein
VSLDHRETKTEAPRLFDYREDPPLSTNGVVQFYDSDGKLAAAVWDAPIVELIRCGPELLHEMEMMIGVISTTFPQQQTVWLEAPRELLDRLTRGAAEGGAK